MKKIIQALAFLSFLLLAACERSPTPEEVLKRSVSRKSEVIDIAKLGVALCEEQLKDLDPKGIHSWFPRRFHEKKEELSKLLGVEVAHVEFHYNGKSFDGMIAWLSDDDFIFVPVAGNKVINDRIGGQKYTVVATLDDFSLSSKR